MPLEAHAVQSPQDHLVFSQMMQELFVRRLGSQLDARARDELRAAGMDLDRPLLPAYPMPTLDAALEIVARHVFPQMSQADGMRHLGRLQVDAFASTMLGRAVFQFMKLLSVERFLGRLTHSWRSANNFIETRCSAPGPGRWEVWVNDAGRFPEVMQGILQAAVDRLGHDVEVQILRREGLACVYGLAVRAK